MNSKEYWDSPKGCNEFYKKAHKLLANWKTRNSITERCCIHHRDDTEECRKYNEEHYELWGYNEDGTFEEGKYVVFMTTAEHAKYHNDGVKNCMYNKHHSDATRLKMSESGKVKTFTEQHRKHLSDACHGELNGFYGKCHTDETKSKMRQVWNNIKLKFAEYQYKHPDSKITLKEFRSLIKIDSSIG